MGDQPPAIKHVALRAGVSVGTVSNVLNHPELVAVDTRDRVVAAIEALGFVANRAAGQLRNRRSGIVGVIMPDVRNPFWVEVLSGIEEHLDAHGLVALVGSSQLDEAREARLARTFLGHGVDGLVLATGGDLSVTEEISGRLHTVLVDRDGRGGSRSSVAVDDERGAELAFEHLLDLGHRRIAFVNGSLGHYWCADRRRGAVRALRRQKLRVAEALVDIEVPALTSDEGHRVADRLIELDPRPTAVVCANDLLAIGMLHRLARLRVSVPHELAVVGFDDIELCASISPSLTSVRQEPRRLGRAAAELLLDRPAEPRHVRFEPTLVIRESSVDDPALMTPESPGAAGGPRFW